MKHLPYFFSGVQATGTITVKRDPSSLSVPPSITVDGVQYTYGTDFFGKGVIQVAQSIAAMLNGDPCFEVNHNSSQPIKSISAIWYKNGVVRIVATTPGTEGNSITLATDDSNTFGVSGATLSDGEDGNVVISISSKVETVSSSTETANGSVAAGTTRVTFISSNDFSGTILGSTFPASSDLTLVAQPGNTLSAIVFEVSAGSLTVYKNTIT